MTQWPDDWVDQSADSSVRGPAPSGAGQPNGPVVRRPPRPQTHKHRSVRGAAPHPRTALPPPVIYIYIELDAAAGSAGGSRDWLQPEITGRRAAIMSRNYKERRREPETLGSVPFRQMCPPAPPVKCALFPWCINDAGTELQKCWNFSRNQRW